MFTMSRYSLVLSAGLLWAASPAFSATWAESMFDEVSKDFGSVPRGPTLVHHFRVVNNTSGPVSIASVRVSCGCVSASALKNYLEAGEETAILARMDSTRFIGPKSVTIYVQFDRPAYEEIRLTVQANGRNDFNVAPDTLAFGAIQRSTAPVAAVTLTFYGSPDTQITEIKGDSNYIRPSVKTVLRTEAEAVFEVTAKLRPDTPIGKWYTDVWVKTNNPSIPQVRVPLTVEVESALSVSPEAVSVGQLALNSETERRVIVRGAKPFKITAVEGTGNQIAVRDTSEESKPVHVLTVKVKGAKPGAIDRTVKVVTDLPEEGQIEFRINGQVMP
jgi:uncharacterized protein DUF1573